MSIDASRALVDGFEAGETEISRPSMPVDEETRRRLSLSLAAIVSGATPEELTGFLRDGFPDLVADTLARVGEWQELNDHLDLLLGVLGDG